MGSEGLRAGRGLLEVPLPVRLPQTMVRKGSGVAGAGCGLGVFAQCAERYIELLNRWFARPHWEYDYQISRIIEISESREYSDSKYLYRIEPAKEPDHSRIRLEPQFLEDGDSSGAFSFEIEGEALDMRRLEEEVLVLMDREEDNIDAYSLEGRFLWNIGEKLPVHRRYDNLYEDICG